MADLSTSQLSEITTLGSSDLLNISKDLGGGSFESNKISIENAGKYIGTNPERIIYVAKNGNDTTGTGSFQNPYLTIKEALANITDNSAVNRYEISVAPGVYSEDNPIQMKPWVAIKGSERPSTSVNAANVTSNLFVAASTPVCSLSSLALGNVTSGYLLEVSTPTSIVIDRCIFQESDNGILISHASANVTANDVQLRSDSGTMDKGIEMTAGFLSINNFRVRGQGNVTTVLDVSGSDSLCSLNSFYTNSNNVTNAIYVSNGADVTVIGGRITGDLGDRIGTALRVIGTNSRCDAISVYVQHADYGIFIDDGALANASSFIIDLCDIGIYFDTIGNAKVEFNGGSVRQSLTWDVNIQNSSHTLLASGCTIDENSLNLNGALVSMCHVSDNEGDEGTGIKGELHVGSPEKPSETCLGEGDSYTRGMNVLTTDSTATSTTDGGNLTDVSSAAQSPSGSTFSFQGTSANHTILIGSEIVNASSSDVVKTWGIKVLQSTAAVEVTPKSFVFEYWNGTNWTEFNVMTTNSSLYYRYANEVFIRSNISEHIRFGLTENDIGSDWAKKTINGKNLYWTRIRINTTITTAPVFQQFKISNSRFEANSDGTNTFHGLSRFRRTITSTGNVFGESGGVTDSNVSVGSGGIPTGWTHNIKNSKLNGVGDALYYQIDIPKGIDTSQPLILNLKYQPSTSGASTDGSIIVSVLPVEAEGVLEADPTGGTVPVERTLANTETVTANAAQTVTTSIPVVDNTKIQNAEFKYYDISNHYEGDFLIIRIELDDDGSGNKDVIIWGFEISGVQWRHGDNL